MIRKLLPVCLLIFPLSLLPANKNPASRWTLGPFTRPVNAPVISPQPSSVFHDPIRNAPVHWEALHTFNPAAIVRNDKIYVLYRAEDNTGKMVIGMHTSRLGLAESSDGIHFTRRPEPVFYPAHDSQESREWPGGVEDPRIVESENGTYFLTYTQWNRKSTDIGIATSRDLIHWTKHGPVFGGKYLTMSYKSAGILTKLSGGRLLAAKLKGKYWMYWGEGAIHLATSNDLIHWSPLEKPDGTLVDVLGKRPGKFDSSFPETGPPPVLTENGIVVIYNGKNDPVDGDKSLGANAYSGGQALFSNDDPSELVARTDQPFFKPELPFEKTGQYAAGTTFLEGLVYFHSQWFLYYGCADSKVGVAIANGPRAKNNRPAQ